MLLDEKETYQLRINKRKIISTLAITGYFYYQLPHILYRKWALTPTSGWVIFYAFVSIIAVFSAIVTLKTLFSEALIFEMTDEGIQTKKFGLMYWCDIKDIKINKSGINNTTLLIFLKSTENFKLGVKMSSFQMKIMNEFDKNNGTPFFIDIAQTNYKMADFDAALVRFKKEDPLSI
jgi:hypothetical protein